MIGAVPLTVMRKAVAGGLAAELFAIYARTTIKC